MTMLIANKPKETIYYQSKYQQQQLT